MEINGSNSIAGHRCEEDQEYMSTTCLDPGLECKWWVGLEVWVGDDISFFVQSVRVVPLRVSYERTKFPQSGNPLHFLGDGLGQTVSFTGSERVQQPA